MAVNNSQPHQRLAEWRQNRTAHLHEEVPAPLEKARAQIDAAADAARQYVDRALDWVASELSTHGLAGPLDVASQGNLCKPLDVLSTNLSEGLRGLKKEYLEGVGAAATGQAMSQEILQDYLLDVAMPEAKTALSPASLKQMLDSPSPVEQMGEIRSLAFSRLEAAQKFLTDHADHRVVQGLALGTASGLSDAIRPAANKRDFKILEDHSLFNVPPHSRAVGEPNYHRIAEVMSAEEVEPRHQKFKQDFVEREMPLCDALYRSRAKVLSELKFDRDGELVFRNDKPLKRSNMFIRRSR